MRITPPKLLSFAGCMAVSCLIAIPMAGAQKTFLSDDDGMSGETVEIEIRSLKGLSLIHI